MKKTNILKIAFTLVLAFVITGTFAQTAIPGESDGVGGSNYVDKTTQGTIDVTIGTTVPLYAWPDPYFSPAYNPVDGSGINAGHSWTWSVSGAEISVANSTDNYVELTGVTVGGPYTVSVVETGTCGPDATPETLTVNVLATPTMAINTPALQAYADCEGGAGLPAVTVLATVANNGASNYKLVWDLEIYTEDATGTPDNWYDTDGSDLGGAQAFAEQYTQAAPQTLAAAGDQEIVSVAGFVLQGDGTKPTTYVYTIRAINDHVSRRGDFMTIADVNAINPIDFTYCDVAGTLGGAVTEVLTITVNPNPITGPIYHIDNNWGL